MSCTTQPVFRAPPLIHYRVLLRTMSSLLLPRGWAGPNYEAIQSSSYIDDPLHPGFKRLDLETSFGAMLQEELLAEGTSQTAARRVDRTITVRADTFDWWIPVSPNRGVSGSVSATRTFPAVAKDAAGKVAEGPQTLPRLVLPLLDGIVRERADGASVVMGLGWEDGAQTWQGSRRDAKAAEVVLRVELDWQADRLHVTVRNRPEDRNYVVFLVVEETFGSVEADEHPPKVLHTAFPIAVNGQLTYVPQGLFDEEKAASDKQRAFAQKYAISLEPQPGHPVQMGIQPGELTTEAGVARLAAALRQLHPEVLRKLTHS